jgi:hypothetical protein
VVVLGGVFALELCQVGANVAGCHFLRICNPLAFDPSEKGAGSISVKASVAGVQFIA